MPKKAIMLMSLKTYSLVKGRFAFMYADQHGTNLLIEPHPEMCCYSDGVGYLMIDGQYVGCYKLEVGDGKVSSNQDIGGVGSPSGLPH